jgi:hypothetical protein
MADGTFIPFDQVSAAPKDFIPLGDISHDASTPPPQTDAERLQSAHQGALTGAESFGLGLVKPVIGASQLVNHLLPDVPGVSYLRDQSDKLAAEAAAKSQELSGGATDWAGMAGEIASPMNYVVPGGLAGDANLVRRGLSAAFQGAGAGAVQPVSGGGSYAGQKAVQTGLGAATGAALSPIADATGALTRWITSAKGPEAANDKALRTILDRIQKDEKGGGPTTQDMLDLLAVTPDKPMIASDVGGNNLLSLLGRIARSPGEAKQIIQGFLQDRDLNAGLRLKGDINASLGRDSELQTFNALKQARSAAAKPLFEEAYRGGSIAPLKDQFQHALDDATTAEKNAAHDLEYAESVQHYGDRQSQATVEAARQKWQTANTTKQIVMAKLHDVQDDIAAGIPGAVWSPRIQQFLDNPRVQQGIQRGLRIERDTALAEGRAMNPTDYAIVGQDKDGNPTIGKVPTARLLAVAKEGLDRMLQGPEFRNELTGELNKEGVAIDQMRGAFLNELDRINPAYKEARAQWAGDTASMQSLRMGEDVFKMKPEEITEKVSTMPPGDKEFFKLGVAAKLREMVAKTGEQGNEARKAVANDYMRDQLRAVFGNDADYDRFVNAVDAENRMFRRASKALSGSQTAERVAEDATPLEKGVAVAHGVQGTSELAHGWLPGAIYHLGRAYERFAPKADPITEAAIARHLVSPPDALIGALRGVLPVGSSLPTRAVPYATPGTAAMVTGATQQ